MGEAQPQNDKMKILVVDDEQPVLESLKMILGIKDYEVVTVTSGKEAIAAIKEDKFDIVLTDIRMPEMDGLEVLRNIKELDPSIEVIMVTAYASMESSIHAMRLGAFDYLTKPFLMEQVYEMVDRATRKRKANLKNKKLLQGTIQLAEKTIQLAEKMKVKEGIPKEVSEAVGEKPAEKDKKKKEK